MASDGLSNRGFEEDVTKRQAVPAVSASVAMETTSAGIYVNYGPNGMNNVTMEEIELQPSNGQYQALCSCEEKGLKCGCPKKSQGIQQRISWESWNKCKTVSIVCLVALVCIWLVVYVTLSQLKTI